MRLGWYLFSTRFLAPGEDGRYAKLRESWGNSAGFKFLIFFLAQGVLAFVLALPFFAISWHAAPGPTIWDLLALAAGIGAVLGEGIADRQLHRFRSDPKNKGLTCNTGLWRYSRHPNYFFEWLYWWSYILLLIGSWWILTALFSAALMLYLITKVTGIPPTEERALASRGDSYRRYQRTVSAFFPWPPKEAA
ncbi:MAG: hypothetical protein DCC75_13385 [Proteobacteria bacterium]|nr:MAG: hypothetical protein DCC75_13385 [Pseudomonadota bacterium]